MKKRYRAESHVNDDGVVRHYVQEQIQHWPFWMYYDTHGWYKGALLETRADAERAAKDMADAETMRRLAEQDAYNHIQRPGRWYP